MTMQNPGERWRHKKRGSVYTIIASARLQQSSEFGPTEGDQMVVYQAEDGTVWVRAASEFLDGRFEQVQPGAPVHSGVGPVDVREFVDKLDERKRG